MITPPIHTTAAVAIEFTPACQDADRYKMKRTEALRTREQALDRRLDAVPASETGFYAEEQKAEIEVIAAEQAAVRDDWGTMERNIAFMRKTYPTPQTFLIVVPTSVEREQVNSRFIQLGLQQITQEMIRATMIEELFHQDWSGQVAHEGAWTASQNEAAAEERANFLDSVWMRQEAHDAAVAAWQEQEVERIIDADQGAPDRPATPMPPKIIGLREQSKLQLLVDHMMTNSQRLRDLAASAQDFARRNAMLLVRMHVVGVTGFEPTIPLERDMRTRALSDAAVAALREQVDDLSWHELVAYIDRLYKIDEAERKNSDSPLGKPPLPSGSDEPSGDQASSDGSSTVSSSTPALDDGSATIIAKSLPSTSGSSTAPVMDLPESGFQTA